MRALRRPGPKGVGKPGKHTARRRLAEPHGRRKGRRSGDCAWQSAPDSSCDVRQTLPSSGKHALTWFWCWVWEARPFPWGQDVGPWPVGQRRAFLSLLGSRLCGHELRGGLTCSLKRGTSAPACGRVARLQTQPGRGHGHDPLQGMAFGFPSARSKAQIFSESCPGAYDARWQTESPCLLMYVTCTETL